MKITNLFLALAACGAMYSCSSSESTDRNSMEALEQEINTPVETVAVDPQVALRNSDNLKLAKYLRLVDNQYVLDITLEEALKLGISKESYEAGCEDIKRENAIIRETMEKGEKITIIDPQEAYEQAKKAGVID